jgi:hypothetical protein
MAPQPEKWEAVKALFQAASALSLGKRAAFLQRNCPDPAVRAEVERQLSEYEKAGTRLGTLLITADWMIIDERTSTN